MAVAAGFLPPRCRPVVEPAAPREARRGRFARAAPTCHSAEEYNMDEITLYQWGVLGFLALIAVLIWRVLKCAPLSRPSCGLFKINFVS